MTSSQALESEGVLTFPAIDENIDSLTLHAEGHSDNWARF